VRKTLVAIGVLTAVLGPGALARAEMAVEWWGRGPRCRHHGMTIELSRYGKEGLINPNAGKKAVEGIHALTFDLSPIPRGTKIYHASLRFQAPLTQIRTDKRVYMDIGQGVWYFDPLRIYAEMSQWKPVSIYLAEKGAAGNKAVWDKAKPLVLEAPNYRSLDATRAVQDWVNGAKPNLGFVVRQLDMWDWVPRATVLEVRYEGDGMYGSYLQSGANMVHFPRSKDMQIIIVDDAAFASASYKSNWNTAISGEKARTVPYAKKLVDALMPWFKGLKPRITTPTGPPAKPAG